MNTIKKALTSYGLDTHEIAIYLHLLSRVESSAYKIAKDLNLPRSTVYNKLLSLEKQGLIAVAKINNVQHYSPKSLQSFFENLDNKRKSIEAILPDLRNISKKATMKKPNVRFYIGKKEMKAVWEDILDSYIQNKPKQIFGTSNSNLFEIFPRFFSDWVKRRQVNGTGVNLIYAEKDRDDTEWRRDTEKEKVQFIPNEYLSNSQITTYGDKTAIFFFDDDQPQSVIIESKEITDIFNRLLKFVWDNSKS